MESYIYQLFLPNESEELIEVFNYYDSRYGNIFFKGELIETFYKEHYHDLLNKYSVVREMQKMGLNVETAKVIVYDLEAMRDYESYMSVIDFENAMDYEYPELLQAFKEDLQSIQTVVKELETKNRWFKFITIEALEV